MKPRAIALAVATLVLSGCFIPTRPPPEITIGNGTGALQHLQVWVIHAQGGHETSNVTRVLDLPNGTSAVAFSGRGLTAGNGTMTFALRPNNGTLIRHTWTPSEQGRHANVYWISLYPNRVEFDYGFAD